MKIILEGCDGTGKTTLAKQLANKYGLDICHCTTEDPSDFDFYKQSMRKENIVWDRHFLGELIYPAVYHRKGNIGPEDARLLNAYANEYGVKVLVLAEPIYVISKRLEERGNENKYVWNKIEEINNNFERYANEFGIPVISTRETSFEEICKLIESPTKQVKFVYK